MSDNLRQYLTNKQIIDLCIEKSHQLVSTEKALANLAEQLSQTSDQLIETEDQILKIEELCKETWK